MPQPQDARDARLDVIRLVAFYLLITCHACDPFNAAATYGAGVANPAFTRWGAVWGSMVRPCVPLFVMLTGALLLGHRAADNKGPVPLGSFYRKRIFRVLWPFLIWSVLYYLAPWLMGLMGWDEATVVQFFPWAETMSQDIGPALERVSRLPFTFSYVACHMWYIYMLIGLYLYLPIFDTWVSQASRRQQEAVLLLWAASLFLPYFTQFVSPYNFGTCDWNAFGTFYYFAGFNGYLLLGHYLYRHACLNLGRTLLLAVPMLMVGYVVCLLGYRYVLTLSDPTPQMIELFWTYCTPNVALMSAALFLVGLHLRVNNQHLRALLANLTRCGFGIFMAHYFFVGPTFGWITAWGVPVAARVPLAAVLILLETWLLVAVLKKALPRRFTDILLG